MENMSRTTCTIDNESEKHRRCTGAMNVVLAVDVALARPLVKNDVDVVGKCTLRPGLVVGNRAALPHPSVTL